MRKRRSNAAMAEEAHRLESEVSQGKSHSDTHLKRVAEIYLKAHESRVSVQRKVAESLGIAVSTAAKQIMAARKSGLISSKEKLEVMREYNETKEKLRRLEKAITNS